MKRANQTILKKYDTEEIIIVLILLGGVFLSLWQFLYNRSLWIDEAMLALNIIHKDCLELLKPLEYNQVAPILFLQIEKIFSTIIQNSEYGLRIFPLLCFWLSLYFFYKVIRILAENRYVIIIALSLFVFNKVFIYYSNEVKQYMTDVLVLLSVFYFVLKEYKKEEKKYYILGIVGVVSIFLSNVAPIILFTCGLYLFYDNFFVTKKIKIISLSILSVVWLSIFFLYYCFFIYEDPSKEYMMWYWSDRNAFSLLSLPINIGKIFLHDKQSIPNMITCIIMISLFLMGIVNLLLHRKTKIKIIILTCTPLALHVFLSSAFQLYPVDRRLILYTLPCIIIICTIGFDYIKSNLKPPKQRLLVTFIPVIFLFCFLAGFPIRREATRESIKYIDENITEGENIYNYFGAVPAFQYYKDIGYVKTDAHVINSNSEWVVNKCMNELKTLQGKNWLLFPYILDIEENFYITQLDSLGYRKLKEFKMYRSSIYLYDFGEDEMNQVGSEK